MTGTSQVLGWIRVAAKYARDGCCFVPVFALGKSFTGFGSRFRRVSIIMPPDAPMTDCAFVGACVMCQPRVCGDGHMSGVFCESFVSVRMAMSVWITSRRSSVRCSLREGSALTFSVVTVSAAWFAGHGVAVSASLKNL